MHYPSPSNNPRNDSPFLINAETKVQRGSSISFSITFFFSTVHWKNSLFISCQNNSTVSKFTSLILTVLLAYLSWSILNTNWVILPNHVTPLFYLFHQGRGHNLHRTCTLNSLVSCSLILHHSPCGLPKFQLHWPLTLHSPNMAIILLLLRPLNCSFCLELSSLKYPFNISPPLLFFKYHSPLNCNPLNIPLSHSLLYVFSAQEHLMV